MAELLRYATPLEIYATSDAAARNADILGSHQVQFVSERAAAAISDTVTPQGLIAVASFLETDLETGLALAPALVAVLVDPSDPGNVGTVIRLADAAGADAVVLAGDSVDPHNGKCVRAAAGSHFHLPVLTDRSVERTIQALKQRGLRIVAADGTGALDLAKEQRGGRLSRPTAWVFGNEAHGLDERILSLVDDVVRIPIYGKAESLNLASAAAVCLYASANATRIVT